ncbi:hypothetical protein V3C99_009352 [Haemonchus contortus]
MRITKQQQRRRPNSGTDECSFVELDRAVCEDLHSVLSHLNEENEGDIWINLARIYHDYCNALEYLGSSVPVDEIRHAFGAHRCLAALVTEVNLLQDYGADKGDSFLASMIAEDHDFRLVYVLWRWCLNSASESKGFGELAFQFSDIRELSELPRTYVNRTVNGKKVGPDPDSMLSAPEDANFEKIIRVVFSLLRCGRFEDAMNLSGNMNVPWLTPLIRSQQLLIDSSLIGANLTNHERARFHFRKLFFNTMVKAISETKYSMGIRMVFAALAGDWQFLLPLAVNVDDRLWCYANAAVQARLNAALGIEHPIFAPTTIEGIFEAIATADPPPYYVLMSYMMREAWEDAVDWMYAYCSEVEKRPGAKVQPLYRFFGLVTSVCRILKNDHDEDHGKALVGRMIDVLLQKQLFSLIPFYAALLPENDGLQRIWNVMPYVKCDGDRVTFIAALNEAGFDGEQIAFEFGRFRIVEMVDHADHLHWIFACGEKKLLNAVIETNNVLRHYLLTEMEDEASDLINECEKLKLVDRLAALVKDENDEEALEWNSTAGIAIDEFNNHCLYLAAQTLSTNFAVECARAHEAAQRKAEDERECDEWSRQGDLVGLSQRTARAERNQALHERSKLALDACKARTLDAITAFVRHPGWRTETKTDWGRSEQLKALRERCYANMLSVLLRNLKMCNDTDTVLDILAECADEELELYKDLSRGDLCRFLLDVHTLAGHALG